MKDAEITLDGETGILASHLNFGTPGRGWDFRSLGRGSVNFEEIVRTLNTLKLYRTSFRRMGRRRNESRITS